MKQWPVDEYVRFYSDDRRAQDLRDGEDAGARSPEPCKP